jgi:hypothetical protein
MRTVETVAAAENMPICRPARVPDSSASPAWTLRSEWCRPERSARDGHLGGRPRKPRPAEQIERILDKASKVVEESLENEDVRTRLQAARETFDRILARPSRTTPDDPLSVVIEQVALLGGRQWRRSLGLKPHPLEFRRRHDALDLLAQLALLQAHARAGGRRASSALPA